MTKRNPVILLLCLAIIILQCTKEMDSGRYAVPDTSTGQGGSMARFTIVGNYLYSVDEQQLKVFNISIPDKPELKSSQDVGFGIETIFPFKDKLFIGSTSQVHIFSIENPENPKKLSVAISPTVMRRCDPVVAKDNVAYATLNTTVPCGGTQSLLAVYNITDITNPVEVNSLPVSEPYGLGYSGNVLYVCDKIRGLLLFDISDAYNPVEINKQIRDGIYIDVIPYGNTLICWVPDGMILYDISDNRDPQLITSIK